MVGVLRIDEQAGYRNVAELDVNTLQSPTDLFGPVELLRNTSATSFSTGRPVSGAWETVTVTATVQPAGYEEMEHLEEGERSKEARLVISKDPLRTINEAAGLQADRVLVDGVRWEVHKVLSFGGPAGIAHYEAICMREQAQ
jgi:hypothetical protein